MPVDNGLNYKEGFEINSSQSSAVVHARSLLWLIFTLIVKWWSLMAEVIVIEAKEEVRCHTVVEEVWIRKSLG